VGEDSEMKDDFKEPSDKIESPSLGKPDSFLCQDDNQDVFEQHPQFQKDSPAQEFVIKPNFLEGDDLDQNQDIKMENEEELEDQDIGKGENDLYKDIFTNLNREDNDLGSFGDDDDPFGTGMGCVAPRPVVFNQSIHYSNGILDSEKHIYESYINPMDNIQKVNKRYFQKMKDTLKSTLRDLIEEKKREREEQEKIIEK
jgi:hypothetical protein